MSNRKAASWSASKTTRVQRRGRGVRERAIVVVFALGLLGALVAFAAALTINEANRNWATVAQVNSAGIDRGCLRARVHALEFLVSERLEAITNAQIAGSISADTAAALGQSLRSAYADPTAAALDSLIDDEVARQAAARESLPTPAHVSWKEFAARWAQGDVAREVRWVRFGLPTSAPTTTSVSSPAVTGPSPSASATSTRFPAANPANRDAARDELKRALDSGATLDAILAALRTEGWDAAGSDVWIGEDGTPAAVGADSLDPVIAAAALRAADGISLGPTVDELGRVSEGRVLSVRDLSYLTNTIGSQAATAGVEEGALLDWAQGQASVQALKDAHLEQWSHGVDQVQFREVVLGTAPTSGDAGPFIELSVLGLDRLAAADPNALPGSSSMDVRGEGLAKSLSTKSVGDRLASWSALVTSANHGVADAASRSGEIGMRTKQELPGDLAGLVFADRARPGDIIGPVSTSLGPQLYLIEARYAGSLDDRAKGALAEVRSAGDKADLVTLTARYAASDVPLARDGQWRAVAEFGADSSAGKVLTEAAPGLLTDPYVLDGRLCVAMITERRHAAPDERMTARLTLSGFDAWFSAERSRAQVTRSDHPLPELEPSASPSSTGADPAGVPTMPTIPTTAPPASQDLAKPEQTDEMGFPVLP